MTCISGQDEPHKRTAEFEDSKSQNEEIHTSNSECEALAQVAERMALASPLKSGPSTEHGSLNCSPMP